MGGCEVDDLPDDASSSGAAMYVNKEAFGPQVLHDAWAGRSGAPAT